MAVFEPKIFPRFRDYAPAIAVPSVYWDVESAEQRIRNICEILGRVVSYADEMGIEVTSISQALADIEAGHLDPLIIEAIEDWFEENEPTITAQIGWLNSILPQTAFNTTNTVKWYIDRLGEEVGGVAQSLVNHSQNLVTLNNTTEEHEREITALQGTVGTHTTQIQRLNTFVDNSHYIACIGDSFGNDTENEWPGMLASRFGYSCLNKCANGAAFTKTNNSFESQLQSIIDSNSSIVSAGLLDYIVIYGGVNDWNDQHATASEVATAIGNAQGVINNIQALAPDGRVPKIIFAFGNCGYARRDQYIGYDRWVKDVINRTQSLNRMMGIVKSVPYWLFCQSMAVWNDDYLHPTTSGERIIASRLGQCIAGTYSGVHESMVFTNTTGAVESGNIEVRFDDGLVSVFGKLQGVSAPLNTQWTRLVDCSAYTWAFGSGNTISETETTFLYSPMHQIFVSSTGGDVCMTRFAFNTKLGSLWFEKLGSTAAAQEKGGYGANWTGSPTIEIQAGFAK